MKDIHIFWLNCKNIHIDRRKILGLGNLKNTYGILVFGKSEIDTFGVAK